MALELGGAFESEVALLDDTGEHGRTAAAQGGGVDAGVLERLPRGLQQNALLGVHGAGLAGRDTEEVGVEQSGPVEESGLPGVRRAGLVAVGAVQRVEVPPAVRGERADGVPAFGGEPPQIVRRRDATGETAGHAHDGDRFGGGRLQCLDALARLLKVGGDPLQVVDELLFPGLVLPGPVFPGLGLLLRAGHVSGHAESVSPRYRKGDGAGAAER